MTTNYPRQVNAVSDACRAFRSGEIGVDVLQASIWQGAEAVVAIEEVEFRSFLEDAESRIELIRFTTNDRAAIMKIVDEVEACIRAHLP